MYIMKVKYGYLKRSLGNMMNGLWSIPWHDPSASKRQGCEINDKSLVVAGSWGAPS